MQHLVKNLESHDAAEFLAAKERDYYASIKSSTSSGMVRQKLSQDFAAIDFETANECPTSVCSVGVVVVCGGVVVDSFYSLIKPEPNYYKWFCQQMHGLGHCDTDDAPVFPCV